MISKSSEALPPTSPPPSELHSFPKWQYIQPTTSRYNTNCDIQRVTTSKNPRKSWSSSLWLQRHLPDSIFGLTSKRKILKQTHSDVLYKLERTCRRFRETNGKHWRWWWHLGRRSALGVSVERARGRFLLLWMRNSHCCDCRQGSGCKIDALSGGWSHSSIFTPTPSCFSELLESGRLHQLPGPGLDIHLFQLGQRHHDYPCKGGLVKAWHS